MRTGYPRFFVPRVVDRLADEVVRIYHDRHNAPDGSLSPEPSRSAVLFPSSRYAILCLRFLHEQAPSETDLGNVHAFMLRSDGTITDLHLAQDTEPDPNDDPNLPTQRKPISAILYPKSLYPLAKAFWQHTGFGISSRQATFWLDHALERDRRNGKLMRPSRSTSTDEYLVQSAKEDIRNRIARGQSARTMPVARDHVLLYPTGMAAITEAAAAVKSKQSRNGKQCVAAVFGHVLLCVYPRIG